ncbi:MAG: hypothetical protein QOJ89_2346 [bacterium]
MLIAFAAVAIFAGVWFVALRPKPASDASGTPIGPTKAVPAAKQAAAASDAANARLKAAANATDSGGSAPSASNAAAAKAPAAAKTPAAQATAPKAANTAPAQRPQRGDTKQERVVLSEMAQGKVVVMLFWSAASADDIAVRGVVRALSRHHGKVKVHVIPIGRVGDYSSITRSVKIAQSPTTLVIGKGGEARTIVGLTDPKEMNQAVGDAIAGR